VLTAQRPRACSIVAIKRDNLAGGAPADRVRGGAAMTTCEGSAATRRSSVTLGLRRRTRRFLPASRNRREWSPATRASGRRLAQRRARVPGGAKIGELALNMIAPVSDGRPRRRRAGGRPARRSPHEELVLKRVSRIGRIDNEAVARVGVIQTESQGRGGRRQTGRNKGAAHHFAHMSAPE
jgi:hypothetical protein